MAITGGEGFSRVLENRRFEDYRSMKQHFQHRHITEVLISGTTTTDGAAVEVNFCVGDTINYIAAQGAVYALCEQDDASQYNKYVYLEYQDNTGEIQTVLTTDLDGANSTTVSRFGTVSDFFRIRQCHSEVESSANDAIVISDAVWGGVDDTFGFINDGNSQFNLERFFTQPAATCASYLGRVDVKCVNIAEAAAGYILDVTFTPKILNLGEVQPATDKTLHMEFTEFLNWEPCIELAPATEVIFKVGDNATAGILAIEATMLEVYPRF